MGQGVRAVVFLPAMRFHCEVAIHPAILPFPIKAVPHLPCVPFGCSVLGGYSNSLCDLAQPHTDVAIAPETVDTPHSTEERFAGNILCQPFVPAGQPPDIEKYVPKIVPVYLFKVRHLLTSLPGSHI